MSRSRSVDTKNKILEVAEKEFATLGYSGAHLQAIAEQVGVQKTALYYYFDSKAALYNAVLRHMLEVLRKTVDRGLRSEGSHEEKLESVLGEINDLLAEHPNYSKILFRMFVDRSPFDVDAARPLIQDIIAPLLRFYREGVDAGEFRRISSRHFFMSMVGTLFFHYASDSFAAGVLTVDDIFTRNVVSWRRREISNLMRHGVLTRPADEPEPSGDPGQ